MISARRNPIQGGDAEALLHKQNARKITRKRKGGRHESFSMQVAGEELQLPLFAIKITGLNSKSTEDADTADCSR